MTTAQLLGAAEPGRLRRICTNPRVLFVVTGLIYMAIVEPRFFRAANLVNVLNQGSTIGLLAVGLTVVLLTGGIDLSMPAVMGLSAICGAWLISQGAHPIVGILAMLAVGSAAGLINALAVSKLKMVPFVVTLAMMQVATGLSVWITKSVSIGVPKSVLDVVLWEIATVPMSVFVFLATAVGATYMTSQTVHGRWLRAVGLNQRAAEVNRVPTDRIIFSIYVATGMTAALTGLLLASRLGAAGSSMGGSGVVLDMVSAAVVGGVSIYGGVGSPMGAAMGAIIIATLNNSLNLLEVDFFPGLVAKGVLLIFFVALDTSNRDGST